MDFSRISEKYEIELKVFLGFAFSRSSCDEMILCPCHDSGRGVCVTLMYAYDLL